jgi:hypothetical protein
VSLVQQILDGSLLSRHRLMEAREFYAPQREAASPELSFARWSQRVAVQGELDCAREMAGLPDSELCALESEFVRCPVRPRTDPWRHAFRVSAGLAAAGVLGFAFRALAAGLWGGEYRGLEVLSTACLLAAVCALVVGAFVAFSMLHLDFSHGTTGLYVGRLDEQHPWLYNTLKVTRHAAAEAYRERVLRHRGPLRGVDYIVMREIVRAQESLERTQWARTVAEQIQRQPTPADAAASEPRLVRVTAGADLRTRASDRGIDPQAQARM